MKRLFVIVFLPVLFAACHLISDDLSVCGEDLVIDYQLQLHTELSLQLQTELMTEMEAPVRKALEKWLSPIFTDKAKDIDLRFFSADLDDIRHQIEEVINDNRTSYTIKLPKENYMHLALANMEDNRQVRLSGGRHSQTMELLMPDKQEVEALNTGIFSARLPMEVNDTSKHFDVHLYMVTAAVALVIDTTACDSLVSVSAKMDGSAYRFAVRDSAFDFAQTRTMLMEQVPIDTDENLIPQHRAAKADSTHTYACLSTVGFATQDDMPWTITFTAKLTHNRRTTTTLTIEDALKAGTLRIIRATMNGKGELEPNEDGREVGASVELDWKEGGEHDIEM